MNGCACPRSDSAACFEQQALESKSAAIDDEIGFCECPCHGSDYDDDDEPTDPNMPPFRDSDCEELA